MNHKYTNDGCNVVIYDELNREIRRVIESDIESTLKQENVIETLENIISKENNILVQKEVVFKHKVITRKFFLLVVGILGVGAAFTLTLLPFNIFMAIILVPVMSFVLTGSMIAIVNAISDKIEYEDSKKKSLQKIIYCQNRKDIEMKKLNQIDRRKGQNIDSVRKEINLYCKDTIRAIERDVRVCSEEVLVPKKRVRSRKKSSLLY